jgi:ribosomal protein S18 acetylase RimI-like enzyme
VSLWDQCILSKLYFRTEQLLLAFDEEETALGFIHFGEGMRGTPWGLRPDEDDGSEGSLGLIHALCVVPHPKEETIANRLIAHALGSLRSAGMVRCVAVGSLASSIFYLGIADGDNLMGVLQTDTRTGRWLEEIGFRVAQSTECWDLTLDTFRPPVDRQQIAIRRSCSISRILEESHPNWWVSTVLGHCDQTRFQLIAHSPRETELEILYWYPDPTILGVDSTTARLTLPPLVQGDELARERMVCLIAESARHLQQERKRTIRIVTTQENAPMHELLRRLGFRLHRTGRGMEFPSDHPVPAAPSVD